MKKTVIVLVSILALLTGACSQIPGLTPTPGTGPTINPDDQFKTAIAQTLTARPPATSVTATDTATPSPSPSPVISNTESSTATQTLTQIIDLSATSVTSTLNVPTATGVPANLTATPTLVAGQVTPIWTLAIRTYGTLPPAVPYSNVTLVNRARTEAYISLQVTMPDGNYSIIEYPVEGRITIQAPVGSYLYVAWVGGRKMVGEFRLKHNDDMTITLYRDRIVVH
jgi:hypothetical protein